MAKRKIQDIESDSDGSQDSDYRPEDDESESGSESASEDESESASEDESEDESEAPPARSARVRAKDVHSRIVMGIAVPPECYVNGALVGNEAEHVMAVVAFKPIADMLIDDCGWTRERAVEYVRRFTCTGAYMSGTQHNYKSRLAKMDDYAVRVVGHMCDRYLQYQCYIDDVGHRTAAANLARRPDLNMAEFRELVLADPDRLRVEPQYGAPAVLMAVLQYTLVGMLRKHEDLLHKQLEMQIDLAHMSSTSHQREEAMRCLRYWIRALDDYTRMLVDVFVYIVEPIHMADGVDREMQNAVVRDRILRFALHNNKAVACRTEDARGTALTLAAGTGAGISIVWNVMAATARAGAWVVMWLYAQM